MFVERKKERKTDRVREREERRQGKRQSEREKGTKRECEREGGETGLLCTLPLRTGKTLELVPKLIEISLKRAIIGKIGE